MQPSGNLFHKKGKRNNARLQATTVLKDLLPELQEENDDEWVNFLLDEIAREVDSITDTDSLFNVIGM